MYASRALTLLLALLIGLMPVGIQGRLPASGDTAVARLQASPRHGEWVEIEAGDGDIVVAWLVYPERSNAAPVVVVIHEIFGLTNWIRAIADDLAAEGFIAIAPDLLSGKGPAGGGSDSFPGDQLRRAIRSLAKDEVVRRLDATAAFATSLPAASDRYGCVGFCWGGSTSFAYATAQASLGASVVYYGSAPEAKALASVKAPVLGLYGGDDARVNATIDGALTKLKQLSKRYEVNIYNGAGHGFLRTQEERVANLAAASQAWPRMLSFFREHLEQ